MSDAAVWTARQSRLMRRAALVFPASGRLGNQLFQYVAVQGFREPGQHLVLVDFDDLAATFTGMDAELRSSTGWRDRLRLSSIHRARHLVGSPLGLIAPDPVSQLPIWRVPGSVATVRGYYQRELPDQERHVASLRFHGSVEQDAAEFLKGRLPGESGAPLAFVQVRRGDYLTHTVGRKRDGLGWVDGGAPVALPEGWYRAGMDELRDRLPGVRFLIVGDDPTWADEHLSASDAVISDRPAAVDLAMLARCDAGVLSASSFAWWGAWFASRAGSGPFIAPRFWLGHAVGGWWPDRIESRFLEYR